MAHAAGMEVFTLITWNSSAWEVVCSSPFVYLCNHLFMSIWTHGYLFYTLGYNPILLSFVAPIVAAWPREARSTVCSFDKPSSLFFLKHFTLWHYKVVLTHSRYSLPGPQNQKRNPKEALVPFIEERYRNQDLLVP